MKKLLLSSVALLGLASGAVAADLPSRVAPAPVFAAVPVFTWTGFYVGVNAGFAWNDGSELVLSNGTVIDAVDDEEDGTFMGGAQIGYNYQMGSIVIGLEGDLQYADFGDVSYDIPGVGVYDIESGEWFGTVRARAGVAFNRALVYATGGFAFADDRNGWTAGGGLEYAFTNNLSAKIEGLYVDVEETDYTVSGVSFNSGDADFGVIRAGLNFRFGPY